MPAQVAGLKVAANNSHCAEWNPILCCVVACNFLFYMQRIGICTICATVKCSEAHRARVTAKVLSRTVQTIAYPVGAYR